MERHNFRKKYHIPIIGTLNAANLLNIGKKGRRLTQTFSFSLEFAADRIIPSGTMKNVLWGRRAFNGHFAAKFKFRNSRNCALLSPRRKKQKNILQYGKDV